MCNHRSITLLLTVAIATAGVLTIAAPARAEDAIVKLVSAANGKCLQPIKGSHNQGDAIVQQTCNGSTAQQWTVHLVSSTKIHLINRASGLCLDARGKAVNGTPIQQWTCNNISNENWTFGITNNLLGSAVSNTFSHCIATTGKSGGTSNGIAGLQRGQLAALDPSQRMSKASGRRGPSASETNVPGLMQSSTPK